MNSRPDIRSEMHPDGSRTPTTLAQLFEKLEALEIAYELYHHEPVFTVAESMHLEKTVPGVHCRNLFLRDKKKAMYLVVAAHETPVDLKKLADALGAARLSFGSEARLWETLGVRPGSVCPFAVMNGTARDVQVVLDEDMMAADLVNYHPLENDKTIVLRPQDLLRFFGSCGHAPLILDMKPLIPEN